MTPRTPFLGRAAHLTWLLEWVERPAARPVLVHGEAGVGKTRLVEELIEVAGTQLRTRVVVARCAPLAGEQLPFAALVQVLHQLLAGTSPSQQEEILGDARTVLAPLLSGPGPVEPIPAHHSGRRTLLLFEAVRDVFCRAGAREATVIVAEDVHWMTPSGLELVRFLLHVPPTGVHLLFTSRGLHGTHPRLERLVAEATHKQLLDVLALGGLEDADVAALMALVQGETPSAEAVERISTLSGGNPYYVRQLAATGGLDARLGHAAGLRAPPSEELAAALQALAVGGHPVPHAVLVEVTGLEEPPLEQGLREAVDARVIDVTPDGLGYLFRHEEDRQAWYDALLPPDRVRMHTRYAVELSRRTGTSDLPALVQLSHHWLKAGDQAKALEWSILAAEAAERLGAWFEALELYRRALSLWPASTRDKRLELLLRAARTAEAVGEHGTALGLLEEALGLVNPDTDPLAAGVLEERLAWYRLVTGADPVPADCRRAVELLPAVPATRERARVLATHSMLLCLGGHWEAALPHAERALAIASTVGAEPEQAASLVSLGTAKALLGETGAGDALLLEGCRLAEALHDVREIGPGYRMLLVTRLLHRRDLESVVQPAAAGSESLRRLGVDDGCLSLCAAVALFELGRWEEARAQALYALRIGYAPPGTLALLLLALLDCYTSATPTPVGTALETAARMELPLLTPRLHLEWLAQLHLRRGEPEQAASLVTQALARARDRPEDIYSGTLLLLGMRAQGDRATAGFDARDSALVADAQAQAHQLVVRRALIRPDPMDADSSRAPLAPAQAATWRAEATRLAGHPDPSRWAAAAEVWRGLGRPQQTAYALLRQAEALLAERHHQRDAAPVVREGIMLADQLGAVALRRELEVVARRAHLPVEGPASPDGPPTSARMGITLREHDVLRLLADGLSNRAIADALVVSPKTVDTHVSHLLMKLGVHDRVSAAARAQRLGLLS